MDKVIKSIHENITKVEVSVESVRFLIKKDKGHISVILSPDGRITITDQFGRENFIFKDSTPEMVTTIAEMLKTAATIACMPLGSFSEGINTRTCQKKATLPKKG